MGSFVYKVKARAMQLTGFFKRGVRSVEHSCKKGWFKVKHVKK